jgi:hypothetical protein
MGLISKIRGDAGVVEKHELLEEYGQLLAENEEIEIGFKVIRDTFIFTNKRLILIDKQGLTGKKVEYQSVLYKSISRFSIETAGHLDLEAELKIYISSSETPILEKTFNKSVNIYDVQKILIEHI